MSIIFWLADMTRSLSIPSSFLIESLSFVGHKLKFALSRVYFIDKARIGSVRLERFTQSYPFSLSFIMLMRSFPASHLSTTIQGTLLTILEGMHINVCIVYNIIF